MHMLSVMTEAQNVINGGKEDRLVIEAERQISGWTVYELADGRWRAKPSGDPQMAPLAIEHTEWTALFWACTVAKLGAEMRKLYEEHEETRRRMGWGRTTRRPTS